MPAARSLPAGYRPPTGIAIFAATEAGGNDDVVCHYDRGDRGAPAIRRRFANDLHELPADCDQPEVGRAILAMPEARLTFTVGFDQTAESPHAQSLRADDKARDARAISAGKKVDLDAGGRPYPGEDNRGDLS